MIKADDDAQHKPVGFQTQQDLIVSNDQPGLGHHYYSGNSCPFP